LSNQDLDHFKRVVTTITNDAKKEKASDAARWQDLLKEVKGMRAGKFASRQQIARRADELYTTVTLVSSASIVEVADADVAPAVINLPPVDSNPFTAPTYASNDANEAEDDGRSWGTPVEELYSSGARNWKHFRVPPRACYLWMFKKRFRPMLYSTFGDSPKFTEVMEECHWTWFNQDAGIKEENGHIHVWYEQGGKHLQEAARLYQSASDDAEVGAETWLREVMNVEHDVNAWCDHFEATAGIAEQGFGSSLRARSAPKTVSGN